MQSMDLNKSERLRKKTRLKALIMAGLVASLIAPTSVTAQGLPGADALGDAPPADEQIDQDTPQADEPEAAPAEADVDALADADLDANADEEPVTEARVESDRAHLNAGINTEGALGFHKIASAAPDKANTYRIGLVGMFSTGSDVIRHNDENDFLSARFLVQAQFLEHLSMNLGLQTRNTVNTFGRPESMLSQGDLHLGLRGHLEPTRGVYLAGDVTGFLPTSFESGGYEPSAMSVRPRMMLSADFGEMLAADEAASNFGLLGHFNIGFLFDNSANLLDDSFRPTRVERFAHQISGYNYLQVGLGLEYATEYVAPFVAWNLDIPLNADDNICAAGAALGCASEKGFAAYPDTLSVGLRAEPLENLGLSAGVDIGLTSSHADGIPVTLPWQAVVGATWRIDPAPRVEYIETVVEQERVVRTAPEDGFILGTVVDAETGEPVEDAVIRYRKPGEQTAQATNARGTFLSYGFAPGKEIVMRVTHPNYQPAEARQMIEGNGEVSLKIELKADNRPGTIDGRVIDQKGKPVANARVQLNGAQSLQVTTDADGYFNQEVPAGNYSVAASAKDFMAGGRDVEVRAEQSAQVEITLKPAPKEELVEVAGDEIRIKQKVFFETGEATILDRSFDVLDQVASLMLSQPNIKKVAINGHTDDVGADDVNLKLSKARAESVLQYLVKQGVSANRLSAKGFGETQPLVPNTSERTRSLNRRVEFKITAQ